MTDWNFEPKDFEIRLDIRGEKLVLENCGFPSTDSFCGLIYEQVAAQANAKLQEWFKKSRTVKGHIHDGIVQVCCFDQNCPHPRTHTARLVDIKEIK